MSGDGKMFAKAIMVRVDPNQDHFGREEKNIVIIDGQDMDEFVSVSDKADFLNKASRKMVKEALEKAAKIAESFKANESPDEGLPSEIASEIRRLAGDFSK